jgi:hypothetical protein
MIEFKEQELYEIMWFIDEYDSTGYVSPELQEIRDKIKEFLKKTDPRSFISQ